MDDTHQRDELRAHSDDEIVWWKPSHVVSTMWVSLAILLGLMMLMLAGLLYSVVGASTSQGDLQFNWIPIAILTLFVLAIHQFVHFSVARVLGASPRLDFDVIQLLVPVIYVRTGSFDFTRSQYLIFALAPLCILTGIGIALMPLDFRSAWLIIPLAANASLATRDVWTAWVVWNLPESSRVNLDPEGMRMVLPP